MALQGLRRGEVLEEDVGRVLLCLLGLFLVEGELDVKRPKLGLKSK
jgi:hypothetical protein